MCVCVLFPFSRSEWVGCYVPHCGFDLQFPNGDGGYFLMLFLAFYVLSEESLSKSFSYLKVELFSFFIAEYFEFLINSGH